MTPESPSQAAGPATRGTERVPAAVDGATTQVEYRVRLEAFEGPLDLLLHLIRRHEVDLHDIPIATITDQYLGHLEQVHRIDIELAGEFLVMAATLMEIKSRMLQPVEEPEPERRGRGEDDRVDPRAELVKQLLEYKQFRDAGDELDRRRAQWERRYPVAPAAADRDALAEIAERQQSVELEDLDVADLFAAFERIYEAVNFERLGSHAIEIDDTPIELHAEDLIDRLGREPGERMTLQRVFEGRTPGAMLGLFLAMLEMLKQQRLGAEQPELHGPIEVFLREAPADEASGESGDEHTDEGDDRSPDLDDELMAGELSDPEFPSDELDELI